MIKIVRELDDSYCRLSNNEIRVDVCQMVSK